MLNDDTHRPVGGPVEATPRRASLSRPARVLFPMLVIAGLVLAGCGGDDDDDTTGPTTAQGTSGGDGGQGTTTPAGPEGEDFTDPEGLYRMTIDPAWTENAGSGPAEVEFWDVAEEADGFTPNVNLLSQSSQGFDLEGYLDMSLENTGALENFELVDRSTVQGSTGTELGRLEFTGTQSGYQLHFLVLTFVEGDQAVGATLTSPEDRYSELQEGVEPFMLTLQPA